MTDKFWLNWELGCIQEPGIISIERIPAEVPGAVQLDWARAHGWDEYYYADNYKDYLWMEDMYWSYTSSFEVPQYKKEERVFFVCKGVDYQFLIKLNDEVIHEQEGMFTAVEIDITEKITSNNELEILVFPAPKRKDANVGREQADQCCKPAISYGWDFHPRLIPLGIWDETYIEIHKSSHIKGIEMTYVLNEDLNSADISVDISLSDAGKVYIRWNLFDQSGVMILESIITAESRYVKIVNILNNPELWWPNGHGEPILYKSRVELLAQEGQLLDYKEWRVGFRKVQLVMHPGAWDYPSGFPISRSNPPITLEINGRQIFCKGTNWVNPEIFPGIINENTYRPLLKMAKNAHMNLIRSWGGGIVNKDCFFEMCDELGIMVWQEFPLACNNYMGSEKYLKILDQESKSIIMRLRHHPCIAIWCSGNELFNSWSGMTDQSLALRLLNRNCYDLDPSRPFLMTSPLSGMSHGNYLFKYATGEEVFQVMPRSSNTAYTEFGCPGPSHAEYLKTIIPENELFPPRTGTSWESHHAFNAWGENISSWLKYDTIMEYFEVSKSLEELVERGQLLQCEGYKCIFEEARRQKPKCSMALNWCYNEPWPTAANNSIVNWPAKPKPAYWAVRQSCRPVLSSVRIPKFSWEAGEVFNPELWILNDLYESLPGGRLEAYLKIGAEEIHILTWDYPCITENTNLHGPTIRFLLPSMHAEAMTLILRIPDFEEMNSEYILIYNNRLESKEY